MTQADEIMRETTNCHQYNKGDRGVVSYYPYIYCEKMVIICNGYKYLFGFQIVVTLLVTRQ